uniref:Small ribosomal subunit protein uS2c n=1 Tax=Sciadococcus taiwanensis TaxID=3028030 RepID=A0A9Y1MWR4_9RHOD|nr:ribosomal protein S2 [Sciadococcus taiwanensis]
MSVITLSELLEAGVHFGHQAKRWNPKIFPYIYTERNGIHIIDLVQTVQLITEAYEFVRSLAEKEKTFLFVGTKRQAAEIIEEEAQRCNAFYISQRWLGGMLTNWSTIKSRVARLKELEQKEKEGIINELPKKEAAVLRRELFKLKKHLDGIKNMNTLPDAVVFVDPKKENTAVQECVKLRIPTIAILDTNCDPDLVDIIIPANDDAIRSIKLILNKLSTAIIEGKEQASNLALSNS